MNRLTAQANQVYLCLFYFNPSSIAHVQPDKCHGGLPGLCLYTID